MTHHDDIFSILKKDHDLHRALLEKIDATHGESDDRIRLFRQFTLEVKGHAAAEEQALYSTVMRKPRLTSEVRHSVAEHHEIEEMLNDLAATDMSSGAWLTKFREMQHRYLHHIEEEEEEHFPDFGKELTEQDEDYMGGVFERRKSAEKQDAEVTPEKMEEAKE
tara:strand:+ start:63211 stop:63702 length:492 start_codon:yes stop_codon:yes gene_type:complete